MPALAVLSRYDQTGHLARQRGPAQYLNCNVGGVRQVVPSIRPHNGLGERRMSSRTTVRTSEHRSAVIQERELARQVSSALIVDFGHYRSTHKTIAQHAGVSPETVKRWIAADSAPSLVYFLRLLPHSPALRKLVAMESELDPQFQRELNDLIQRHIR